MACARITAQGQTTIPKAVRDAVHLEEGDLLSFEVEGDHLVVRKVAPTDDHYLIGLEGTLGEWNLPNDDTLIERSPKRNG